MNTIDKIKETLALGKMSRERLAEALNISVQEARSLVYIRNNFESLSKIVGNKESIEYVQKLAAQKQRFQDTNRIERKVFRKDIRIFNVIEDLNKEMISITKEYAFNIKSNSFPVDKTKPKGIIQLSDLHANEIVRGVDGNNYDMTILSKRVEKHIKKSIKHFSSLGITDIILVMTGDMENSNRRIDEITAQVTSRTVAQFLVSNVLVNAILDLNQHFNVSVSYVDGNESRVDKDLGWNNVIVSDTFDTSIYMIVRNILKDKEGIKFDNRLGGKKIINVNNQNILLLHGHQKGFSMNPQNAIDKIKAQYSAKGINIRMVLFGHIHTANVSEFYARSGSTVGANAYSENALTCTSRASQNLYVVYDDGSIDSTVIDLQEYEKYSGYEFDKKLIQDSNENNSDEEIFKI